MNLLRRRIIPDFRSWSVSLDGRERKTDNYYSSFFKLHSLVVGDDGFWRTAGAKKKSEEKKEETIK
jgi:hypothetical protein